MRVYVAESIYMRVYVAESIYMRVYAVHLSCCAHGCSKGVLRRRNFAIRVHH